MASATILLTVVRDRCERSAPLRCCRLRRLVSVSASACVILLKSVEARSKTEETWERDSEKEEDSERGSCGVERADRCDGKGERSGSVPGKGSVCTPRERLSKSKGRVPGRWRSDSDGGLSSSSRS